MLPSPPDRHRWDWRLLVLGVLALGLAMLVLPLGRYPISLRQFVTILYHGALGLEHDLPPTMETIVFHVRLPRVAGALLVGAALSVAGAAYQGIFRNPLVSPDILGASTGAGLGAAIGILLSAHQAVTQLLAFSFGVAAAALAYAVSRLIRRGDPILTLVLAGILVGTMFSSLTALIKFVADPYDKLPAITFWLMGSLAAITLDEAAIAGVVLVVGFVPLFLLSWQLNVLAFGDEEAQALGVNVMAIRGFVLVVAAIVTASAISIAGMVGWVGLVIPHLARSIVGPDYRQLLPASALIGSAFLLAVDTAARLASSVELPLGILTALIGAPFFLYLLAHSRRGWT